MAGRVVKMYAMKRSGAIFALPALLPAVLALFCCLPAGPSWPPPPSIFQASYSTDVSDQGTRYPGDGRDRLGASAPRSYRVAVKFSLASLPPTP